MLPLALIEISPVDVAAPVVLPAQTSDQIHAAPGVAIPQGGPSSPLSQPQFSSGAQPNLRLAQAVTPADPTTVVTPIGDQFDITGGQLSGDGANLFHSFEQFGLGTSQTANFIATPQIQNILGRVVGGNASVIDGLLQLSNSNANLFLINPAGILFGANARLNLPGSFTATTADRVGFGEAWFDAFEQADYRQLVGDPTQFSFGAPQPGSIVNAGELAVGDNQSLTLLGGNVINTGTLSTSEGQIAAAAVPGQQTVRLGSSNGLLSIELKPLEAARDLSALSLPALLTGGGMTDATELAVSPDGTVSLNGVTIPDEAGIAIVAGSADVSGQQGGELNVLGERVALVAANLDASGTAGGGTVRVGGGYQGQEAVPNAELTYVSPDSAVLVNGGQTGDAGQAIIWADGLTQFEGSVEARGGTQSGDGGFVEVSGKEQLVFRGTVQTDAIAGQMGTLLLDPINIVIADGTGDGDGDSATNTFQGNVNGLLGQILEDDFPGATITLFESELEGLGGNTNVILQATNNITINNLSDNQLTFAPGSGTIEFDTSNSFAMDGTDTIATNGRNLTISGSTLTLANLLTDGGDIDLSGNILLPANATFSTGVGQPGDIALGSFSQTINSAAAPVSLALIAGDGDISLEGDVGNTMALSSLTMEGAAVNFFREINTFGGITVTAQDLPSFDLFGALNTGGDIFISSQGDLMSRQDTLSAGGSITITTPGNLTIESGSWSATNDISLISEGTALIIDAAAAALTLDAGGQLTIQGTDLLRVQANNNPASELRTTTGDLILRSNGVIVADADFNAGGDFLTLTLAGDPGDLSGTSPDTLISSNGNVSFGDYLGLALKVEAQGSISGGDITIVGPNPALAGGDPDIAVLNSAPALILRAGSPPQNAPNLPGDTVGGTQFSDTAATAPANIEVGDIDTSVRVGEGGPVILSATGSITTGDVNTVTAEEGDPDFPPYIRGGIVDIIAGNSVVTQSVTTAGGEINISGSQIQTARLDAYNLDTNLSDQDIEGRVTLTATTGDIEVGSIRAGVGGLAVEAAEQFRAIGETVNFNTGIEGNEEGALETVVQIQNSPEVIEYLVSQGFDRADLETSEATVSIYNNVSIPASVVAYSGNSLRSNVSIRHGGVDLPDNEFVQIDGGGEAYDFAIGPAAGPEFSAELAGFDPFDSGATLILVRADDYTVYDTIPETISGTVGAIVVGNDRNNGQVYSTFLNRPLPPEIIEPGDSGNGGGTPGGTPGDVISERPEEVLGESLISVNDSELRASNEPRCQFDDPTVSSDLVAARSGERDEGERSVDLDDCTVPEGDNILQVENDILQIEPSENDSGSPSDSLGE